MNIDSIPKSFWHSISFAIVILTLGFMALAFMYGNFSIRWDKLEIRAENTIALEENLKAQEETIRERETEIEELRTLLEKRAAELIDLKDQLDLLANLPPAETDNPPIGAPIREDALSNIDQLSLNTDLEERIREKQQTLSTLKDKQDQYQQVYETQKAIITKQAPQK